VSRRAEIITDIAICTVGALFLVVLVPIAILSMLGVVIFDAISDAAKRLLRRRKAAS
jgi:hypothetical protein